MTTEQPRPTILMVDDDEVDVMIVEEAIKISGIDVDFHSVNDGAYVAAYIRGEADFERAEQIIPDLILMDVNMPLLNGLQALNELKGQPDLCTIPIVMMTTSSREADIVAAYSSGASSYITKPGCLDQLTDALRDLGVYWFDTVLLPPHQQRPFAAPTGG